MSQYSDGAVKSFLGATARHDDEAVPGMNGTLTKRSVSRLTRAMSTAFASAIGISLIEGLDPDAPPLVIALFQRASYFESAARRYAAYAAAGATVIVGMPGPIDDLPPGIVGVDLTGWSEFEDAWVLVVMDGALASALVAVDEEGIFEGRMLEESRQFTCRWTVRRDEAIEATKQILNPLGARLPRRALSLAEGALRRSAAVQLTAGEDRLATILQALRPVFMPHPQRSGHDEAGERDVLTGLPNMVFLDRYLEHAPPRSTATVATLLVDIDDLGALNARLGRKAGDDAISAVATALSSERRSGDVVVRYGADEFLVLATVGSREGALAIAQRLIMAVRTARLARPNENESVTVSVGVATSRPGAIPFPRLYEALRVSKALGKNTAQIID